MEMKWLSFLLIFFVQNTMGQKLFIAAGQSNAVGMGDSAASVICDAGTAFEYRYKGDTLISLKDPVGAPELHFEHAYSGSAWPAFAKAYHDLTGQQVVIVQTARGGSSCHYIAEKENYGTWDSRGRRPLLESAIKKASAAMQKTGQPVSGIIWSQGERDGNAINEKLISADDYEKQFMLTINEFRKALGNEIPFYIIQTGYYLNHSNEGFDQLRSAQKNVARKMKNVFIVYSQTIDFEKKGWLKDPVHYNQTALNDIGATVAKKVVSKEKK